MTQKIIIPSIFTLLFLQGICLNAQSTTASLWKNAALQPAMQFDLEKLPHNARIISLQAQSLQTTLNHAPLEFSISLKASPVFIELPMPDGSNKTFHIVESPVAESNLLKKYPALKTYLGVAVDDASCVVRLSNTARGFFAMIKQKTTITCIEPISNTNKTLYKSFYTKNLVADESFICHSKHEKIAPNKLFKQNDIRAVGNELRRFRLAVSTTGEYAQFHGGTIEHTLAAIVTTINRVNLFFELETATRFILVENNDELIFTNPTTDPFNNNSLIDLLEQNQSVIDEVIGAANYDIGHVFGTKGGGLAGVGGACSPVKAWGATGLNSPIGDAFDVVYVAHELGHQLNAPHSFNNCNGDGGGATAYEPGSGTTIMAYAGLCGNDNVQFSTDYHFHSGSYERIVNGGNLCVSTTPTNNTPPTVQALDPTGLTIPVSTPFELTGMGSDVDGDVLTYTWDEMDKGPISSLGAPTGNAPLFRFMPPTDVPVRTFPNLENLNNNTFSNGEILPFYSRSLNFRITARDNRAGSGGVNFADYSLEVSDLAGPFLVTSPNTSATEWIIGEAATIEWDVANTDQAPVNAPYVSIYLSTDGGNSYMTTLAENIPNIGNTTITVPNIEGNQNRIKIKANNHVFFDISNENFSIIEPDYPSFIMTANANQSVVCPNEIANYTINIAALGGFDSTVSFTASGLPNPVEVRFSPENSTASETIDVQISGMDELSAGIYPFTITATSGAIQKNIYLDIQVLGAAPNSYPSIFPTKDATDIAYTTLVEWTDNPDAMSYTLEVATSPSFGSTLIESASLNTNSYLLDDLSPFTVYYWRLQFENNCGLSQYSEIFAFQTKQAICTTYQASNLPIAISNTNNNIATIEVDDIFAIKEVRIPNIQGTHSFVSDLSFALAAPDGTSIQLTNPICGGSQNFNFGFADNSENSTISCPPTSGDLYQSQNSFTNFVEKNSKGAWNLIIVDQVAQDDGFLTNWNLELCYLPNPKEQAILVQNNTLAVAQIENVLITRVQLEAMASNYQAQEILYSIRTIPTTGFLKLDNQVLEVGHTFTQADINNNLLQYEQDGSYVNADAFTFDVFTPNGSWLASNRFDIDVQISNLSLMAELTIPVSCHNQTNAQVTLLPSGGMPPYRYSLDGINFQDSNIFSNLGPNKYSFIIKDALDLLGLSQEIDITNPLSISVSTNVVEDQIIAVASGGTGQLQYSIDGVNFGFNPTFSNLDNGSYTITVKDENLCRETTHATIAINNIEVLAQVVQPVQCFNSTDGKITALVTGGTPPFLYSIDNTNFQQSPNFENLSGGTYTIFVEEIEGFSQISQSIHLDTPPDIQLNIEQNTNSISILASGGTGTLLYSADGVNFQNNPTFSTLQNSIQSVFVQDANGCILSLSLPQNDSPPTGNLLAVGTVEQGITCHNANDAIIALTAIGGTAPYQYQLGMNMSFQQTNIFENLADGSYPFQVKDANGLVFIGNPIQIVQPDLLELNPVVNNNTITVNAVGGTGDLLYQLNGAGWQNNPIFDNVSIGSHSVAVQDANLCSVSTTVLVETTSTNVVQQEANLSFQLFPNPSTDVCTLMVNTALNTKKYQLQIKDIQGKLWQSIDLAKHSALQAVSIEALPSGVYQVILTNGKELAVQRLVKL